MTTNQTPTTPVSSPLDTLKALVLRNISALDFVTDRLAGGYEIEAPDYVLEFLDGIRQQQYRALAEHMPVGRDDRLGELRHLPCEAYHYDDGSPVALQLTSPPGVVSTYYPRYDGDRAEFEAQHREAAEQVAAHMAETEAPAMVTALDEWREQGGYVDPPMDEESAAGVQKLMEAFEGLGPGATLGDLFNAQQNAAENENGGDAA